MPNLDELLSKAMSKPEKKIFSRGNRPDTLLKSDDKSSVSSAEKSVSSSSTITHDSDSIPIILGKDATPLIDEPSSNLVQNRFKSNENKNIENSVDNEPKELFIQHYHKPSFEIPANDIISTEGMLIDETSSTLDEISENENPSKTRFEPSSNLVQTKFEPSSMTPETSISKTSNQVQTRVEPGLEPSSLLSIKKLSPLQILILDYLNQLCIEHRSDTTSPVKIIDLVTLCNCSIEGAKTAIKRMLKQKIISRIDYKDGRNGWCQYQIPSDIHKEVVAYKKIGLNLVQTRFKPSPEPGSSSPSKLVSNKELTKLDQKPIDDDFLVPADLDLLQVAAFGITRKHVQDIKNQKLNFTTSTLQDFINRFAEYAKDPKNIKNIQSVPAIFCKMAQLASKGEDPLIDIETDVDRLIRERIERLKTKQEDRVKQQTELIELEFENWLAEIKTTGQDQLAKPTVLMKSGSISQKMTLKNHFIEQIWPEKAKVLGL